MNPEELIREAILKRLSVAEDKIAVIRPRRISCEVEIAAIKEALDFLSQELKFSNLTAITGLDEGEKLSVIYHLSQDGGIVLSLKTSVDKNNPVLQTVINSFPSAEVYERELVDLLGFKVEGLPEGNRYPLTDDWPKDEYPLRKDWKYKK